MRTRRGQPCASNVPDGHDGWGRAVTLCPRPQAHLHYIIYIGELLERLELV